VKGSIIATAQSIGALGFGSAIGVVFIPVAVGVGATYGVYKGVKHFTKSWINLIWIDI
jgi:hypothetical protein